jgi:hypothetical protein
MSQSDLKKRSRKKTRNNDDLLNKTKPKKGRGRQFYWQKRWNNGLFETDASFSSLTNDISDDNQGELIIFFNSFNWILRLIIKIFFIQKLDARTTFTIN